MAFEHLKVRNNQRSVFKDEILPARYSKSAGATSSVIKANEGTRLVRCKHCGWICDRDRDVRAEDQTFAGIGVSYGSTQRTGAYVGDTDGQLKLNMTTTTVTSTVTKSITSRVSAFYGFDGGNALDGVATETNSASFETIATTSARYQLMHNRIINAIHLAVASAPGAGKEIQAVVCVNNETTDMRAVVTGTATYAVSASSALETGVYAPVKIQFNYDEDPSLSMMSYSLVLQGSGEQTYHGPTDQQNSGTNAWGLHGAGPGGSVNLGGGPGQPYMYNRTVQIGSFKDLYVKTAGIAATSTSGQCKVSLTSRAGAGISWYTSTDLFVSLGSVGTTFSNTTYGFQCAVGDWIGHTGYQIGSTIPFENRVTVITQVSFVPQTSKHFQYFLPATNMGADSNKTNYMPISGVGRQVYVTSAQIAANTYPEPFTLIPMDGTIKGMTTEVGLSAATSPLGYTLRKNGVDTSITLSVDTNSNSGAEAGYYYSTSTAEVSVVAGDKISVSVSAGSDGDVSPDGCVSTTFVPSDDNVYPVFYNGLIPINVPAGVTTTESYTVVVSTGEDLVGDAYSLRDVRSGCPSCGSYLYDGDEPFQEVKFDV